MGIFTLISFFVKMAQQKKKKWSQTRIKEKVDNQNFIDIKTYERIIKEISKDKLITPSILTTRFRISCSLAKKILIDLSEKQVIEKIKFSSNESIFSRV